MSLLDGGSDIDLSRSSGNSSGGFGLSFIDVVSGGFGAAFFLFIVFVTMPTEEGGGDGGGSNYVDVMLSWENPRLRLNLIMVHVSPLGNTQYINLNDRQNFGTEADLGLITPGASISYLWDVGIVAGWANGRNSSMNENFGGDWRATWFRLTRPCPGEFRFFVSPTGLSFNIRKESKESTKFGVRVIIASDNGRTEGVGAGTIVRELGDKGFDSSAGQSSLEFQELDSDRDISRIVELSSENVNPKCPL